MADTLKRMYFGQPSAGTGDLLYTAPGSGGTTATAVIRNIHVANTSNAAATFTLSLNAATTTTANCFIKSFSVPANGVFVENLNIVLNGGNTVYGANGTASALTILISGVEL